MDRERLEREGVKGLFFVLNLTLSFTEPTDLKTGCAQRMGA